MERSKYQRVANVPDVSENEGLQVPIDGHLIAVFNAGGCFYAIDDTCTHAQASLADGHIEDGCVECPLHGGRFELATGRAVSPPVTESVKIYPIQVNGGSIYIKID